MLVTCIFSFSDSVFQTLLQGRLKSGLCCKELTLYHTIPTFNDLEGESFCKHCGKGENAGNQNFFLFQKCFLPFPKQIAIFQSHSFCRLQNAFNFDWSKILSFDEELIADCQPAWTAQAHLTFNAINTHFDASTTDSF